MKVYFSNCFWPSPTFYDQIWPNPISGYDTADLGRKNYLDSVIVASFILTLFISATYVAGWGWLPEAFKVLEFSSDVIGKPFDTLHFGVYLYIPEAVFIALTICCSIASVTGNLIFESLFILVNVIFQIILNWREIKFVACA